MLTSFFEGENESKPQARQLNQCIKLNVSLPKDTANFGDKLELNICFVNRSGDRVVFYPEAVIGITHYNPNVFINYDSAERIIYYLNNKLSTKNAITLMPNESFLLEYNVTVNENFFYKGNNRLQVFYRFYDTNRKRIRKMIQPDDQIQNELGPFWSHVFTLEVK